MRTLRGLLTAAVLTALIPSTTEAQEGRRFENAWFWGVKTGGMAFSTFEAQTDANGSLSAFGPVNRNVPLVGIEWLITRNQGGLYVSLDQSFVESRTALRSSVDTATVNIISLDNVARVNIAAMVMPNVHRYVQPYAGLGFGFMQIGRAEPVNPTFPTPGDERQFYAFVDENKSQFQPLVMLGAQARVKPFSIFAQGMVMPFRDQFLLRGRRASAFNYEIGLRYNVGTSIDRL